MDFKPTIIESATTYTKLDVIKSWIPSVIVGLAGAYFLSSRGEYSYLDAFDLLVHEAGHVIFSFLGETIYFLGGTLMQLIVPILLLIFCFSNRLYKLFQIITIMLGQSFLNISVYVGDAQTMKLRLFGPPGAKHDWNFLLTKYDILASCGDFEIAFVVCAVMVFLGGMIMPLFFKE